MPTPNTQTQALWQYNRALLTQAMETVQRLQAQARPGFDYAQAVGPHLRHIIEHYQALLRALRPAARRCVDYDERERDLDVQSRSEATLQALRQLMAEMATQAQNPDWRLDLPLETRLRSGPAGEFEVVVPTTLGRELLFLSSHTVHHFALLGHYCKAAGVDLGPDFGKAPATVAFERTVVCA